MAEHGQGEGKEARRPSQAVQLGRVQPVLFYHSIWLGACAWEHCLQTVRDISFPDGAQAD